jgi:hypothetical protein
MRFIMRERLTFQIGFQALAALSGVHRFETFRERACSSVAAQSQSLIPLEKMFDGSAKTRPILHLSRNGAFHQLTRYAGIKNKSIGKLHRLTHAIDGSILLPLSPAGYAVERCPKPNGEGNSATVAKALVLPAFTARLKSCPDTKLFFNWLETG